MDRKICESKSRQTKDIQFRTGLMNLNGFDYMCMHNITNLDVYSIMGTNTVPNKTKKYTKVDSTGSHIDLQSVSLPTQA